MQLFSPAKLNLFLRVVSKREDGYHNLSSLFQTISLGDFLHMELHPHDVLTCTDPDVPLDRTNLVLKAADLFRKKTGFKQGFKMHLDKRIPMQAGLGGGSSNAASALWGCAQLAQMDVPVKTLMEWGAELGSDVPFFFSEGTAYCTGRGEHVRKLDALSPQELWVVKPAQGLSTPEVFRRFKLAADAAKGEDDLQNFLSKASYYFNDLELPAFAALPALGELKDALKKSGFETVLMTGSGTAFFCMGSGAIPPGNHLRAYRVSYINRSASHWYAA